MFERICKVLAFLFFGLLCIIWLPFAIIKAFCLICILIVNFCDETIVADAWDDPVTQAVLYPLGIRMSSCTRYNTRLYFKSDERRDN